MKVNLKNKIFFKALKNNKNEKNFGIMLSKEEIFTKLSTK
jgi:hypothetical protein